jgi:hypothetical protein
MISTKEDFNKYRVWREIINEAKKLTAAGYGGVRFVRGMSYDFNRNAEAARGGDPNHMDA